MARPVYGITVLRYEDGRTEVAAGYVVAEVPIDGHRHARVPMPESWEHQHAMLIDALEQVKREAGQE